MIVIICRPVRHILRRDTFTIFITTTIFQIIFTTITITTIIIIVIIITIIITDITITTVIIYFIIIIVTTAAIRVFRFRNLVLKFQKIEKKRKEILRGRNQQEED